MSEPTPVPAVCQLCGGPVSKRNTSGFCHQTPECKRKSLAAANDRYHEKHPEKRSERWAAYTGSYKGRRAALDAERRKDPEFRERVRLAVQEFKTDPANAERVREYNRRGHQRYMARSDRPCLFPDGCGEHAKVGSKFCAEHQRTEANRHYHRTAAERKAAMAEAQSWICPWCSGYLPPSLARTHVDHIIPRASGFVIEEDWNFQLLHARCNQAKSDRITPQAIALAAEHGLALAA